MLRPAQAEDFAAIAAITNHYIPTAIHFGYEPVTGDALAQQWRDGQGRYPWFVVTDDDVVCGYAKAGVWRARDAYRWTAEVGLYLAPSHHRRGLGRALYGAVLDRLAATGFRSAIGGVTLPNAASVALHRALGFDHVGTFREVGWKLDAWHDVAFFQKLLATGPRGPALAG